MMTQEKDDSFWRRMRDDVCLDPNETYLNAGSYSPVPRCVLDAAMAWRSRLASSPMRVLCEEMPKRLVQSRDSLSDYLGAAGRRLLLLPNATYAVNLAVRSIELPSGSEILLTDHEYGAMRFCWERAAAERGWRLRTVELPYRTEVPARILEVISDSIGAETRVLFFSHVTSPTGLVLPAQDLCRRARQMGLMTVVDGAHAPGMIPLALNTVDADYYAGNCHKWMMAPTGAGFLSVSEQARRSLAPLVTSWGWEFDPTDDADSGWGGSRWSQRVEFQGTQDRTAQLVLPEAIAFRRQLTEKATWARTRALSEYLRDRMATIGWQSSTPSNPTLSGSMVAFEVPLVDPVAAREWCWQSARIAVPFTRAAGKCFLRVSTAWFNTQEELDRIVALAPMIPFATLDGS